jgi:parvulin-like peptidyl-prolyl isomerase
MKNAIRSILALAFALVLTGPGLAAGVDDPPADGAHAEEGASAGSSGEVMITLQAPLGSPLFADTPVAVVADEPITFGDLRRRLSSIHAGRSEDPIAVRKNYANLLERVVTTKLIVQEARNIGLDELPEIESQIDDQATELLMSSLMQQQLASVEPDEAEVNELYRKMSREFLLTTLKFRNEEDAVALEEQYKSGAAFDELAKRFIEEGRAEGELGGQEYMKLKDFLPTVAQVAFEMEVDSVSEILTADGGFLLFHILDVRFYEDPALKEEARQRILGPVKKQKAREYGDSLERKYATIDEGLLEEADFESRKTGFLGLGEEKPVDFQELLDDDRVVATVHSDPPYSITVGDLARKVKQAYFHGIEKALEQHEKLNERRRIILKNQIFRRTTRMEAASRGLDQTEEYLNAVEEYTNSLLFDTFINKVVLPDVEISEEEVRKYYEEHADDFSSPRMLRVNSLVFYSLTDAESALRKLNERADFKWVSANSPGQVDKDTEGICRRIFGRRPRPRAEETPCSIRGSMTTIMSSSSSRPSRQSGSPTRPRESP